MRGGGKNFSRNLRPLEEDDYRDPKPEVADSSEEEESEEEGQPMTREERRAAAKARKDAAKAREAATKAASGSEESEDDGDGDGDGQPTIAARKPAKGTGGLTTSNPNDAGNNTGGGLSRREREAVEAAAAKERYWKLQEAGKTDQAKADLARLALIRQERDEKARQRKAELEEKKAATELKASMKGGKRR